MKYIILVLWTFSLFLLMFSSFPFRVECRPTRAGPGPPRPQQQTIPFNHHLTSCPVLEGPSAKRFNPWPDLYTPDITAKVWESPIVLEGTARSRSEVRPDGTFGVTFDLHRVVKGDAPLLRRRRQFRLQFLENFDPSSEHFNRDRDLFSGSPNRRNNNPKNLNSKNNTTTTSTTSALLSSQSQYHPPPNSKSRSVPSSNSNNNNNNFNTVYNSHSNPPRSSAAGGGGTMTISTGRSSSLNTKQLHQSSQLQLYHQQQSRTLSGATGSTTRQGQGQGQPAPRQQPARSQVSSASSQFQQFRQSPSSIGGRPTPRPPTYYRNSSLGGNSPFQLRPPVNNPNNNNNVNRNLGGGGGSAMGRRSGRNASNYPRNLPLLQQLQPVPKCVPPKATVKTGRKYYVFAAKVENHFIAVFSAELANKRNTKAVESILCPGCGQAPSVVAAKDVQLNVKERLRLRCRLRAGNPIPLLTWYKDDRPVNLTDTGKFRLRTKRRQSILVIRKARESDVGVYRCEAKNVFGSAYASVRVSLSPSTLVSASGGATPAISTKPKATTTTTTSTTNTNPVVKKPSSSFNSIGTTATTTLWPLEARECPYDSYCLNGGVCSYFETIGEFVCQCAEGYQGQRCDTKDVQGSSGSDYESTRRLLNLWD
ncbi:pro-neuregulin-2, membrane-bound isoform isoform X3 [Folsomia candida]|uniref:pro-neuregulin-2, membrane-bound isoform isoform X3 n=1 Tax=Folsomia candida TaxID=158441 RepID=UPI001604D102|nr:pro-neuregulin-2, membrane-bound isoform isoform X3 [Folsomia candida]